MLDAIFTVLAIYFVASWLIKNFGPKGLQINAIANEGNKYYKKGSKVFSKFLEEIYQRIKERDITIFYQV